jgi:hypothetical protein
MRMAMNRSITAALLTITLTLGCGGVAVAAECLTQKSYSCSANACQTYQTLTKISFDDVKGTVNRCDKKGCDTLTLTKSFSGVMDTYSRSGYSLRVNTMNNEFVEMTSLLTNIFLSYGVCKK